MGSSLWPAASSSFSRAHLEGSRPALAAAWLVMAVLEKKFENIELWRSLDGSEMDGWYVYMEEKNWNQDGAAKYQIDPDIEIDGETAPLAICRAALKAMEREAQKCR